MKLYTEKQVKKVWKAGQKYWETSGASITLEELLEQEKSIELPSDDKIIYKCFQKDSYELATDGDSVLKIYSDGYKAALEQILNQNK